jgi:Arc/MetJ-type ribon-helix-helix transcriptional regulator
MTVLKPRSRIISVRLSEEEYSALVERCGTTNARSVSELTRHAMKALLSTGSREEILANWIQIENIDQRIERIERWAAEFMKSRGSEVSGSSV